MLNEIPYFNINQYMEFENQNRTSNQDLSGKFKFCLHFNKKKTVKFE